MHDLEEEIVCCMYVIIYNTHHVIDKYSLMLNEMIMKMITVTATTTAIEISTAEATVTATAKKVIVKKKVKEQ